MSRKNNCNFLNVFFLEPKNSRINNALKLDSKSESYHSVSKYSIIQIPFDAIIIYLTSYIV